MRAAQESYLQKYKSCVHSWNTICIKTYRLKCQVAKKPNGILSCDHVATCSPLPSSSRVISKLFLRGFSGFRTTVSPGWAARRADFTSSALRPYTRQLLLPQTTKKQPVSHYVQNLQPAEVIFTQICRNGDIHISSTNHIWTEQIKIKHLKKLTVQFISKSISAGLFRREV